MRDSEIEQWVLNEISLMTGGLVKEVCVLSRNGVVSLQGTLNSRADKHEIQKAAARANGVVAVINHLKLSRRNLVRRRTRVQSPVASIPAGFQLPTNKHFKSSQIAG